MERLKEKDVIRYALNVLSQDIVTKYQQDEKISAEDKKYLAKIKKMLPKYA